MKTIKKFNRSNTFNATILSICFSLFFLVLGPIAKAESERRLYGEVLYSSKLVKVKTKEGKLNIYKVTNILDKGSIWKDNYISMGNVSKCSPFLGYLAEDFLLTIKPEGFTYPVSVTAPASGGLENEVLVYGTCGDPNSDILQELVINANGNLKFNVQEQESLVELPASGNQNSQE